MAKACLFGFFAIFPQAVAGQGHQEGRLPRSILCANTPGHFPAVHAGQADIEQHDVGVGRPCQFQRCRTRQGYPRVMSPESQDLRNRESSIRAILHHQNT